ncbi:MAG: MopE-related protein, partial [Bacteroidota bacterium]
MTEWGIALLYASTTNGAKNCTIQNNTITMSGTYPNAFGIYSNSVHSATTVGTLASASGADGANHGLKIYGNTINSALRSIVVIGPTAAADVLTGLDIGGTSAATGNTLVNFGGVGVSTTFSNVPSASGFGIFLKNCSGANVNFNTLTSTDGLTSYTTGSELYGILFWAASSTAAGSYITSISNNCLDLRTGAVANGIYGIYVSPGAASNASTLNINCNRFTRLNHNIANPSGAQTVINTACAALNSTINGNIFDNLTVTASSNNFTFISADYIIPATGTKSVNNNSIKTGFARIGNGGSVRLYYDKALSTIGTTQENINNNFSNINVSFISGAYMRGWENASSGTKNITGNKFQVWTLNGGAGSYCIWNVAANTGTAATTISANIISNIDVTAGFTAIYNGSSATGSQTINVKGNTIYALKLTSAASTYLNGMWITNTGITSAVIEKNNIYNLEYVFSGAGINEGGPVRGIVTGSGTDMTIKNNFVGDLRAPYHNYLYASVAGLDIGATGTRKVYYNTVYLNASSTNPTSFSSAALITNTSTASLILRNNLFVNLSTANGTGLTMAIQSLGVGLLGYDASSNNNLLYAGTPSASKVIYSDGTNADQTLAAFRTRLADTRDNASITINPTFLSTTSGNLNYLHIDPTVTSSINSGGVAITGLTDDFDGDTRSATPDIGADEFTPVGTPCTAPVVSITTSGSTTICKCTSITLTATGGATYRWNTGETASSIAVSNAGVYTVTATNASGCKAEATQTITLAAPDIVVQKVTASPSYTWNLTGQTYTEAGRYQYESNCAITILELTIGLQILPWYVDADGDGFVGEVVYQTTRPTGGYLSSELSAANKQLGDCNDSLVTINPAATEICFNGIDEDCDGSIDEGAVINTNAVSSCDSYTWGVNGTTYTQSGSYSNISGCTKEILNLTITTSSVNSTNQTAAGSYTWTTNGQTYTQSGTYSTVNGCTTEILNLTITTGCVQTSQPSINCYETATWNSSTCQWDIIGTQPVQPTLACYETATFNDSTCQWDVTGSPNTPDTTTVSTCSSYTWAINGSVYTSSGTYTYTLACQEHLLNLIITPSTSNTSTASACDSYTWSVNGQTYTQSGSYSSVNGCHTEILSLTITPSTSNTSTASACDSYTWSVNGQTYTQSGTYSSVNGCHTEILSLTITSSSSNTTTDSACDNYTWSVDGQTYTQSGTYSSVNGCHTEILSLTITPSTSNTSTETTCDSYTWSVNGQTYTQSGTYSSVNGCHTEILSLTITPSTSNTTTETTCDSYTWSVDGQTYTQSGTYSSVNGCHTEILSLTITPSTSNTTTASACDSYTWSVNGQTYTQSGTYSSVNGCHTEILSLTITPSTSNTSTASACDSYTWSVNGQTYTQSGSYSSVNGCHTENLSLTIITSTSNTTNASACDSYTWSVNSQTYTQSGTYSSVNGCHTELLHLTINLSPTVAVSPISGIETCANPSITITGSGATSYSWSNGGTGSAITVSNAAAYTVIGTDANGCTAIA